MTSSFPSNARLCLDTPEQMVASIMSKKLAAGSTHLLIDLPVGPTAKLTNAGEAMRLRKLFEFVGDQFGIAVEVITTDGRQPIGNGIGPVLEAEDVMAVLTNDARAPADLREKSLRLAAHLLEYDPQLRGGAGYARARQLLDSGAALKKMQEIIDAQGPSTCRNDVGKLCFRHPRRWRRRHFRDRLPATESAGANRGRPDRQGRRHQAVPQESAIGSSRVNRSTESMPTTKSELDLAVAAARRNSGYADWRAARSRPRINGHGRMHCDRRRKQW